MTDHCTWMACELRTMTCANERSSKVERIVGVNELWFCNRACLEDSFTQLGILRSMWANNEMHRTRMLRERTQAAAEHDKENDEDPETHDELRRRIIDEVLSDDSDMPSDLSEQEADAREADVLSSSDNDDVKPPAAKKRKR